MAGRRSGAFPFVGRGEESASLFAALDAIEAGELVTVLVNGEPGIGKTALVRNFTAAAAGAGGVSPHWGSCREIGGIPAFWPWVQVVRSMGGSALEVGRNVLNSRPDDDPFATIDSVLEVLHQHADVPRIIVLDDLHRADRGSLELLRILAADRFEVPVLVIGTHRLAELRGDPERDAILGEVARHARVLGLTDLADGEIAELLRGRLGAWIENGEIDGHTLQSLSHQIRARSGGNPLFARALIDAVANEDTSVLDTVPAGIRAAVRARLAPLPAATLALVSKASVLGPAYDLDVLAELVARPAADIMDELKPALAAGVVIRAGGSYGFEHVLIRDALEDELSQKDRAGAHLIAARILSRAHAADVSRATVVAQHLVDAGELAGPGEVATWLDRAAIDARRLRAYPEAARLGRLAVTYWRRAGNTDAEADALAATVSDFLATGDAEPAVRLAGELAALGRRIGSAALLARAALARAEVFDPELDMDGAELLREALAHADPQPLATRAALLAELAAVLGMPSIKGLPRDLNTATEALSELAELAGTGDRAAGLALSYALLNVESGPKSFGDRQRWFRDSAATASGRMPDQVRQSYWAASLAFEAGNLAEVEAQVEHWRRIAERGDSVFWKWRAETAQASLHHIRGRFEEAERVALAALPLTKNLYPAMAFRVYAGLLFAIRRDQGRLHTFVDELGALASGHPGFAGDLDGHGLALLAPVLAMDAGDAAETRRTLQPVIAAAKASGPEHLHWLCMMSVIATCADFAGATDECASVASELEPFSDQFVMWGRSYVGGGPVSLLVGTARRGCGDHDGARRAFAKTLEWADAAGSAPSGVRARLGLASVLDREDPARRELLAAAHDMAMSLGMEGAVEQARRLSGAEHLGGVDVEAVPPRPAVRVLGRFEVVGAGASVPSSWTSRKARDALKILVCRRGRSIPREQLIDLLWPDADVATARGRLSVVLSMVRTALDPDRLMPVDPLRSDRQAVALDLDLVSVDAELFLAEASRGRRAAERGDAEMARGALRRAAAFPASAALAEDPYADWSSGFRMELDQEYRKVLRRLVRLAEDDGNADEAIEWRTRLVMLDADDDVSAARLIVALDEAGRGAEAEQHRRTRLARAAALEAEELA